MPRALREALAAFRRAPTLVLVSVVAVGLSLFVVGLFALTAFNIEQALEQVGERVEVVAYLRESGSPEQLSVAQEEILLLPEVLELRYVSKTEALAVAVQELPEFRELFSGAEVNPLPGSFEVRLRPEARTQEAIERLAQHLLAYPFVEDVNFGREWVAKLVSLQRVAAGATAIIGGALALVAAIIIGTAVRIAVSARRDEIEIMRLVGATDHFIRAPFLIEGLLAGFLGGVMALGLTYAAFRFVNLTLLPIVWLPGGWLTLSLAFGAVFGLMTSAVAVRRQLASI